MSNSEQPYIIVFWVLMILLIGVIVLFCCGCNSRTFFYSGQMADVWSTHHAVQNGAREMNPLYGDEPSLKTICLIKGIYIGITELLVHLDPYNEDTYYSVGGVLGWVFGTWNISQ